MNAPLTHTQREELGAAARLLDMLEKIEEIASLYADGELHSDDDKRKLYPTIHIARGLIWEMGGSLRRGNRRVT